MANICMYEIRVIGTKEAADAVYDEMSCMDYKEIDYETTESGKAELHFSGNCKWSVNWDISLQDMSEEYDCEIMVHYWSAESEFDQFDHYVSGEIIKQRKIAYRVSNDFDWDSTEFIGHEGEYDESVDGEASDRDMMSRLLFATNAISGGSVVHADMPSYPKETTMDMFAWTFEKGKTAEGEGWQIAIPDSFCVVDSEEERLFEGVPENISPRPNIHMPVRILPGIQVDAVGKDSWPLHSYAKEGMAYYFGSTKVKVTAMGTGCVCTMEPVTWGDFFADCIFQETAGKSINYQITVYTKKFTQHFRVETGSMTARQRKAMDKSVLEWIKTFSMGDSNDYPANTQFEDEECFSEIVEKGTIEGFEAAIDQAEHEYIASLGGKVRYFSVLGEMGELEEAAKKEIKPLLKKAMQVREFYLNIADALVEKLQAEGIPDETMRKIFSALHALDEDHLSLDFDDDTISIPLNSNVKKIRAKWSKAEQQLGGQEQPAKKSEPKKTTEKRAAEKKTTGKKAAEKKTTEKKTTEKKPSEKGCIIKVGCSDTKT